jgi:hypothetical protein
VKYGVVLCSNVIDVAALESHNLEHHEYLDRVKHYTQKLQSVSRWTPPRRPPCLLVDIPAPEKLLAAEPLTKQDLQLVSWRQFRWARSNVCMWDRSSYTDNWGSQLCVIFGNHLLLYSIISQKIKKVFTDINEQKISAYCSPIGWIRI